MHDLYDLTFISVSVMKAETDLNSIDTQDTISLITAVLHRSTQMCINCRFKTEKCEAVSPPVASACETGGYG